MFKIWFQLHGSSEILEAFFNTRLELDVWFEKNADALSFGKVMEVFH